MLGGGVAMTTIGLVIGNKRVSDGINFLENTTGPIILTLTGIGMALGSIPFFISSAKNAHGVATISFKNQKILFPLQNTLVLKT